MQTGEGQLHLRLDARRPDNPTSLGGCGQLQKECSLAATRLAAKNQHLTMTPAHVRNELTQHAALARAVEKLWRSPRCYEHAVTNDAIRRAKLAPGQQRPDR
jgi:hypothetical protein